MKYTGRKRGYYWARDARPSELNRLTKFAREVDPASADWGCWFTMCAGNAYSAAERLFFHLHPKLEGDRQAAANFWGGKVGDYSVQLFAEGALQYLDATDTTHLCSGK